MTRPNSEKRPLQSSKLSTIKRNYQKKTQGMIKLKGIITIKEAIKINGTIKNSKE